MVKTFTPEHDYQMSPHEDGDYVLLSDYQELEDHFDELMALNRKFLHSYNYAGGIAQAANEIEAYINTLEGIDEQGNKKY